MTDYPFIDKHQACKILNCSESTLRRRMQTDLTKDIHWVQRNKGEAIKFNQRLLEDYMAHLGDPNAHLAAILPVPPQAQSTQTPPQRLKIMNFGF